MYERLQSEAVTIGLDVQERDMKGWIKGLYGDNVIWINKRLETSSEKSCILAEEIGHHHTTSGNILNQATLSNRKQEASARGWAFNKLIPLRGLIEAFEIGCKSKFEIAEFLNVTEFFLEDAINFFYKKYGTYVKVDDKYYLFFSPLDVREVM